MTGNEKNLDSKAAMSYDVSVDGNSKINKRRKGKTMRAKYVATDKTATDGSVIYHRRIPAKGRPARYIKRGERFVKYVTPKAPKTVPVAEAAV